MLKKLRLHIILSVLALAWILYVDSIRAKPINWFPSFYTEHKIPYGTYALKELLPDMMNNSNIIDVKIPPYVKLKDSTTKGTYFFVNNRINFGKEEMNALLDFVNSGNNVFISSLGANVDTLNLETTSINTLNYKEELKLVLANPNLDTIPIKFKNELSKFGFKSIDSTLTEVLGYVRIYDEKGSIDTERINFIRQKFGKGYFYFHLYPHAFTNYFVLNDSTSAYVSSALSYLDDSKPLLWDSYYKSGKSRISTPMYYILSSKNLKWAYYTAIFGIILFVIFKGKRTQRIIPILHPLKNQTLAFTKTISNLYFEKKDHKSIAQKHIFHFLDYLRNVLHISTDTRDKEFIETLASKSANSKEEIDKLFKLIDRVENSSNITKEQLINLYSMIQKFKSNYQTS